MSGKRRTVSFSGANRPLWLSTLFNWGCPELESSAVDIDVVLQTQISSRTSARRDLESGCLAITLGQLRVSPLKVRTIPRRKTKRSKSIGAQNNYRGNWIHIVLRHWTMENTYGAWVASEVDTQIWTKPEDEIRRTPTEY